MNIKRGLLTVWLALSAPWIAYWSWHDDFACLLGFDLTSRKPWCITGLFLPNRTHLELAELMIGPPLALGAAIVLVLLVIRGFKISN
ncbi:hypothetical protein [Mesorhizobium sp. LNJC394B00]|uniref:hypothetical protein n=1 Tax=Mesorhizobium sp. LNJC394B00 TaxID=1287274 RepID=UPI0003CDF46A|nr:hypothetical protein [Mesorhizobium sp. LNJC394B00]ESY24254.1 hypothetical protein X750_05200 [Mesorhizobium sp. LNJC394B00]